MNCASNRLHSGHRLFFGGKVSQVGPDAPEVVGAKFLAGYFMRASFFNNYAQFGAWHSSVLLGCKLRQIDRGNAGFASKHCDFPARQCVKKSSKFHGKCYA